MIYLQLLMRVKKLLIYGKDVAGVGLDLSKLRPDGAKVSNAANTSSGAWSFADFYSYVCKKIRSRPAEEEHLCSPWI